MKRFVTALAAVSLLVFITLNALATRGPASSGADLSRTVVPVVPGLLALLGDRHLAANIGYIRVVTLSRFDDNNASTRAQIQQQTAFYNPRHEDNYDIAGALLPWEGEVKTAQEILLKAAAARPWDAYPYLLAGLNAANIDKNYNKAASYIAKAAVKETGQNRDYLLNLAAKYHSQQRDLGAALAQLKTLQQSAVSTRAKRLLAAREQRLQQLLFLQTAVDRFFNSTGSYPQTLDELQTARFINTIPKDPYGQAYTLFQGQVIIAEEQKDARH